MADLTAASLDFSCFISSRLVTAQRMRLLMRKDDSVLNSFSVLVMRPQCRNTAINFSHRLFG
jgi:hypothetical protein